MLMITSVDVTCFAYVDLFDLLGALALHMLAGYFDFRFSGTCRKVAHPCL